MLDLRHNGGGLVEEARLVASIFLADGPIVTTRGRTQPTITLTAAGDAISPAIPVVVLVDRGTASAAEIVAGALQDRHRATIVGTHTFGKGVFQEVRPLSNGGALDITVGEYFLPSGRNLGGGGIKQGAGITPDVAASAPADRDQRPGAGHGARAWSRRSCGEPAGGRPRAARAVPGGPAGVRAGGGREAEDPWGAGQLSVDPGKARAGELVLVGIRSGRRGARATVIRRLGRPDVARDVIEALMLERGLRRRFGEAVELEAQAQARAAGEETGVERRDLRELDTFTIDPTGARDYDDAISAERIEAEGPGGGGRIRVWVHIADVASFVPAGVGGRPGGSAAGDERLRAGGGRADAPAGAV